MLKQSDIIKSLYNLISLSLDISVYESEALQSQTLPFCVFDVVTDTIVQQFSCFDNTSISFQVSFFGDKNVDHQNLRTYSDTLYEEIHNQILTIDTIDAEYKGLISCVSRGRLTRTEDMVHIIQQYTLQI